MTPNLLSLFSSSVSNLVFSASLPPCPPPPTAASASSSPRLFPSSLKLRRASRDMIGGGDERMTRAWPDLRRFCRERQVEVVEVDPRFRLRPFE